MCRRCRAESTDPRHRAFVEAGLLEVLSTVEAAKANRSERAWVVCTGVSDGPAAAAKAALMAITDDTVFDAKVRYVSICLN